MSVYIFGDFQTTFEDTKLRPLKETSFMVTYNIDNDTFLQVLFKGERQRVHVCSFPDDPSNIPQDRRAVCWAGGLYGAGGLPPLENQYFCISLFSPDEYGVARRRKALFESCRVFVLDDVEEKIPAEQAARLPKPTYILRTSAGSTQWGYRLKQPSPFMDYTQDQISNAQDGLISSDLVPSGKDPGMRGVTRLVRLPGGGNSKASRLMFGEPFQCFVEAWNPEQECTLEDLVKPFDVELNLSRAEGISEGQTTVSGHPVLAVVDVLSDRGGGLYDIICPLVSEHTDHDTSGTSIWTYPDGRAGFCCHHSHGDTFKGGELMSWCREQPGWDAAREAFTAAQASAAFAGSEVAASGAEGVASSADVAPNVPSRVWSGPHDILNNIVTITEGKGGFFNLQTNGRISGAEVLNSAYGHLIDGVLPGTWLRTQPAKQVAQGIGWMPSAQKFIDLDNRRLVNTYRAPHVVPVRNDALIEQWLILCNYIYGHYVDIMLDHMAFTLQFPEIKIRWQALTVGKPRTGKTMSVMPLVKILGSSCGVVSQDNADVAWGDVFAYKKALVFEEVHNNDRSHFNRLKSKLSNDELEALNIKGQGYLHQPNLYSIYMFTNFDNALQFDTDQDKLLVIRAPDDRLSDEFYSHIGLQIDHNAAFISAVYAHLLDRDVSGFQYGSLPERTEAMYAMCKASRNQAVTALLSAMKHVEHPFDKGLTSLNDVKNWLHSNKYSMKWDKDISETMTEGGWMKVQGQKKVEGKTVSHRYWAPKSAVGDLKASDLFNYYAKICGNMGMFPV